MVPGDPERLARKRTTVDVDEPTWREMVAFARDLGVELPPQ
jgi:hypothetical protein